MMIEKKAKGKGKAIIGIAMAAIMVASVFVAIFSSSVFALTTPINNENLLGEGKGRVTVTAGGSTTIIIGETIEFTITGLDILGVSGDVAGQTRGTTSADYETSVEFMDSDADYLWSVDIDGDGQWNPATDMKIYLMEPTLEIEIQDAAGRAIDSTTIGQVIQVDISSNLFMDDMVKLKITGPDGTWTEFSGAIEDADERPIDTCGWMIGDYEIWVVTRLDGDDARGLDISSDKDTITIIKAEIVIEAETETPSVDESVLFTVSAPPYEDFHFSVASHADEVVMTHLEKNPLGLDPGEKVTMDKSDDYGFTEGGFNATTDEDGIYKFVTKFTDARTYTFQVWFGAAATYYDASTDERDDIDIDVKEIEVTIDAPRSVVVGEDVTITVTASAGDDVDIVIGDILEFNDECLNIDGEAEMEWDTAGKAVGTYTIEVFVNCDVLTSAMLGTDVGDEIEEQGLEADGKTTIRLIAPGLVAKQPRNEVAEGDDYTIGGTTTGTDEVDIVLVGPEGYPAADPGLGVLNGLEIMSSSVTDDEFSEEETMTEGLDLGTWKTMVFAPGRDAEYGDLCIGAGELGCIPTTVFAGKDQDQIVTLLKDHTVNVAGSDDLLVELTFEVETPYVRFDLIESVTIGEPLEIAGTTNREPGTIIVISTFAGPTMLPPAVTEVEWPTADQGVFAATIDTTDAVLGTYTLKADDGDGHSDTTTVEIVKGKPSISISTDKYSYCAGETMHVGIEVANPLDSPRNVGVDIWLEMPAYPWTYTLIRKPSITLPAGLDYTNPSFASFVLPDISSGTYTWYSQLFDPVTGDIISSDTAVWTFNGHGAPVDIAEVLKTVTVDVESVGCSIIEA